MARTSVDIELRWGDLDAYGHVNNVAYARFVEEARARTFWLGAGHERTGMEQHFNEHDPHAAKMLVASQQIEFLRVLEYSAHPITVELWIGKVGGSSMEIHYEILDGSARERTVVARVITTVVMVDGETFEVSRLSAAARAAVTPWMDEPLRLRRG